MYKPYFFIAVGLTFLLSHSTSFAAQTTLNFQNPKKPATTNVTAPIPPSDFANQVKTINDQNHTQFKQQLDQKKNELSRPKIPTLSDIQATTQTPPPPVTATEEPVNTLNTKAAKPSAPTYTAPPPPPVQPLEQPAAPTNTPAAAPTPPPASSQQPYTGFSSTPSSTTGTQQKNNTGGGFNIKY